MFLFLYFILSFLSYYHYSTFIFSFLFYFFIYAGSKPIIQFRAQGSFSVLCRPKRRPNFRLNNVQHEAQAKAQYKPEPKTNARSSLQRAQLFHAWSLSLHRPKVPASPLRVTSLFGFSFLVHSSGLHGPQGHSVMPDLLFPFPAPMSPSRSTGTYKLHQIPAEATMCICQHCLEPSPAVSFSPGQSAVPVHKRVPSFPRPCPFTMHLCPASIASSLTSRF